MVKGLAISDQNCWMGTTTKVICKEQLRIFEFKKKFAILAYIGHIFCVVELGWKRTSFMDGP